MADPSPNLKTVESKKKSFSYNLTPVRTVSQLAEHVCRHFNCSKSFDDVKTLRRHERKTLHLNCKSKSGRACLVKHTSTNSRAVDANDMDTIGATDNEAPETLVLGFCDRRFSIPHYHHFLFRSSLHLLILLNPLQYHCLRQPQHRFLASSNPKLSMTNPLLCRRNLPRSSFRTQRFYGASLVR